jgi:hypothetical protein
LDGDGAIVLVDPNDWTSVFDDVFSSEFA